MNSPEKNPNAVTGKQMAAIIGVATVGILLGSLLVIRKSQGRSSNQNPPSLMFPKPAGSTNAMTNSTSVLP